MATSAFNFVDSYNGHDLITNAYLNTGTIMIDNGRGQIVPERTHTIVITDDGSATIQDGVRSQDLLKALTDIQTHAKAFIDSDSDPALTAQLIEAGFAQITSLDAPANFVVDMSVAGQATLTWDDDILADQYLIERATDPAFLDGFELVHPSAYANPVVETGLVAGTHYYYYVVAFSNTLGGSMGTYADGIAT